MVRPGLGNEEPGPSGPGHRRDQSDAAPGAKVGQGRRPRPQPLARVQGLAEAADARSRHAAYTIKCGAGPRGAGHGTQ